MPSLPTRLCSCTTPTLPSTPTSLMYGSIEHYFGENLTEIDEFITNNPKKIRGEFTIVIDGSKQKQAIIVFVKFHYMPREVLFMIVMMFL